MRAICIIQIPGVRAICVVQIPGVRAICIVAMYDDYSIAYQFSPLDHKRKAPHSQELQQPECYTE